MANIQGCICRNQFNSGRKNGSGTNTNQHDSYSADLIKTRKFASKKNLKNLVIMILKIKIAHFLLKGFLRINESIVLMQS